MNQAFIHGAQHRAAQQKVARTAVDAVQHFINQIIRKVAGINAGQSLCRLMRRRVGLPFREGDQLQCRGPARDFIAQTLRIAVVDRLLQAAVEKLARFIMGEGQRLAVDLQQLFTHAQVSNAQRRQIT